MSCAAATVNVVTTDGPAGRSGVTVSAMSSVSADGNAPTLLVCVHEKSPASKTIIENGCFCVNVLRDDQSYVSDTFAGRTKTADGDKFSCGSWATMTTGAPRFVDPLTAFDCKVKSSERVGTHHVFIGEVQEQSEQVAIYMQVLKNLHGMTVNACVNLNDNRQWVSWDCHLLRLLRLADRLYSHYKLLSVRPLLSVQHSWLDKTWVRVQHTVKCWLKNRSDSKADWQHNRCCNNNRKQPLPEMKLK